MCTVLCYFGVLFSFVFFLRHRWARYGCCSSFIFGQLTHRDAFCACISFFLFDLIIVSFSSICVFISLFVASLALALIFMPGLYSAASRVASLA